MPTYAFRQDNESVESMIRRVSGLEIGNWRFPELTETQVQRISKGLVAGKDPVVKVGGMTWHYELDV